MSRGRAKGAGCSDSWRGRLLVWLLAIASGVALALCFPRFDIETLVWVWAAPLMVALWWTPVRREKRRFWRGLGLGYLAGVVFFAINLFWITEVTLVGAAIFPLYLGLYFAVWGGIAATVGRPRDERLARLPSPGDGDGQGETAATASLMGASRHALRCALVNAAAWVCLEWLRGWLLTGFGWNGLGVALHRDLNLIQIADVVGVTGLSFLPIFVGCVLVTTVRRFQLEIRHQRLQPHLDFGLAVTLVASVFLYGLNRTLAPEAEGADLRCVIVQLAVPQDEKWDPEHAVRILEEFENYTVMGVEATDPDLVIWPESSLPTSLFEDPYNEVYLNRLLEKGDFTLMLGANDFDVPNGEFYNAAVLVKGALHSPHLQIYHKNHLVPFGEFVPFRKQLPFLDAWLSRLIPGDFSRGTSTEPFDLPGRPIKISPLICFEDTVGRLARRCVRPAPQLLVNMSNDGWFGRSPAAEQHLANACFRCVELRRPMARACNTGVSCLIDVTGRITDVLSDSEEGVFVKGALMNRVRVPEAPEMTFYARFGDVFSGMMAVVLVLALALHRRST